MNVVGSCDDIGLIKGSNVKVLYTMLLEVGYQCVSIAVCYTHDDVCCRQHEFLQ